MAIIRRTNYDERPTHEEAGHPMYRDFDGRVVDLTSFYMGDGDSSYGAIVYDPGTDNFVEIGYCSTYCPGCDHGRGREVEGRCRAVIDAPAQLRQRFADEREAAREAAEAKRQQIAAEQRYHTPSRGAIVEVVAGRKVPRGVRGMVFWHGDSQFGPRIGLELPDGSREFIAAYNVEVVDRPGEPPHRCSEVDDQAA